MALRFFMAICIFGISPLFAKSVTVAYTANRQGEIEPCGCKVREIGGLSRMENRISLLRKEGKVLFVDAGNTFFSAPKLSKTRLEGAKKKAELIAKAYKRMELKAFSPGERDFSGGTPLFWQLVRESGATPLSANLESPSALGRFEPYLIWEENGVRIALTGLTSFDANPPPEIRMKDPKLAMRDLWKKIQTEKPERVIVLSHLGAKTDEELAKEFSGVWFIGSKSMDFFEAPKKIQNSFLFEVGIEGQRLGEIYLEQNQPRWTQAKLTELGEELEGPPQKTREKK